MKIMAKTRFGDDIITANTEAAGAYARVEFEGITLILTQLPSGAIAIHAWDVDGVECDVSMPLTGDLINHAIALIEAHES